MQLHAPTQRTYARGVMILRPYNIKCIHGGMDGIESNLVFLKEF